MSDDFDLNIDDLDFSAEEGAELPPKREPDPVKAEVPSDRNNVTHALRDIAQSNPFYFPNDVLWKRLNDDLTKDIYYRSKSILNFLDNVDKAIRPHWATILFDYLTPEDRIYAFGGIPRPKSKEKPKKKPSAAERRKRPTNPRLRRAKRKAAAEKASDTE